MLPAGQQRYSVIGTLEGAINRDKHPTWTDNNCSNDAIARATVAGQTPSARVLQYPLPGLFNPQVLLSRVEPNAGRFTLALDLRALRLGIKALDVSVGVSARQLLSQGTLHEELVQLGRTGHTLACQYNLAWRPCDDALWPDTESLTLFETHTVSTDTVTISTQVSHNVQHPPAQPDRGGSSLSRQAGPDTANTQPSHTQAAFRYTVFDTVHHLRILPAASSDTINDLIAKALSLTPELPTATGHILTRGIGDLPEPQIVLRAGSEDVVVVPIQYLAAPVAVCTIEGPSDASAFQLAYAASGRCGSLRGVHHQIAQRTAAFHTSSGVALPFKANCVRSNEAVILQGFIFESTLNDASRPSYSSFPAVLAPRFREDRVGPDPDVISNLRVLDRVCSQRSSKRTPP